MFNAESIGNDGASHFKGNSPVADIGRILVLGRYANEVSRRLWLDKIWGPSAFIKELKSKRDLAESIRRKSGCLPVERFEISNDSKDAFKLAGGNRLEVLFRQGLADVLRAAVLVEAEHG